MTAPSNPRSACRTSLGRFLALVLFAAIALMSGPAAGIANAQNSLLIKVYVVRAAAQNGGVADTLPEIAQRTLGDPTQASAIFSLNEGRTQADGGALTQPNQTLHPGWILRLPSNASGPFVQFASDTSGAAASWFQLQLPVILATVGGLGLIGLTLFILLRRRPGRLAAKGRRLIGRLGAPLRRRKARANRLKLATQWRSDTGSVALTRAALSEATGAVPAGALGPLVVDLVGNSIRVLPAPASAPPQPWQGDGSTGWSRPYGPGYLPVGNDPSCRPVRVGGVDGGQTFVDLSHCDGALAITGDKATSTEVLVALLNELGLSYPDLTVVTLGPPPVGTSGAFGRFRHSSELAALIGPPPPVLDNPLLAAARRRWITGVVAVPAGTPFEEGVEVARLCSSRASSWIALIVGDVQGAHWRWEARRDGTMRLPLLDKTVIATM